MTNRAFIAVADSDTRINFLEAVKLALDKFPRIRNPVERARLLGRPLHPIYYRRTTAHETPDEKVRRVKRELVEAGMTIYGLLKAESRFIPKIIHSHEHIEAVIYGQHNSSSAMMLATDERIIYLDKKPMVEMFDEVSYEVISGIEFDIHTFFATVVLHTPVKNYEFRYVNLHCAEKFARHIEKHRLEREPKDQESAEKMKPEMPRLLNIPEGHGMNDMAGYYWLPAEEEERRRAGVGP